MKKSKKIFYFLPYQIKNDKEIYFNYQVKTQQSQYFFSEKILLPSAIASSVNQTLLDKVLVNLSLILGISYWKIFTPEKIELKNINLSFRQAEFWNTVYTKGLGEFFYKNKIDFRNLIQFPYLKNGEISIADVKKTKNRSPRLLLGFGGGKDSIVAAEKLKKNNHNLSLFVLYTQKKAHLIENVIKITNLPYLEVYRFLDEKLFYLYQNLPQEKIYNGHVPISAIISFIELLLAVLYDFDQILTANEKSANEGNVFYLSEIINHQWSKSEEYENLFNRYLDQFIAPDIDYHSVIRDLTELDIGNFFSQYPQYFYHFSSCNQNFKINKKDKKRWCGDCPKCLFTYLILAPFLPKKTMIKIFSQDLLNKKTLVLLFEQLLGKKETKPFECVGTKEDVVKALKLLETQADYKNDYLITYYKSL
jgi:tRNA(Ile)-lysidine synthase TilS/MesJ